MATRSFPVDVQKVAAWIKSTGLTQSEVAKRAMFSDSFFPGVWKSGTMSFNALGRLRMVFEIPDGAFDPDPIPEPVKEEPMVNFLQPGYSVSLQVYPKKIRLSLNFDGEEVRYAYSHIKGDAELDLIQAISYAAHMLYKFAEQDSLDK